MKKLLLQYIMSLVSVSSSQLTLLYHTLTTKLLESSWSMQFSMRMIKKNAPAYITMQGAQQYHLHNNKMSTTM